MYTLPCDGRYGGCWLGWMDRRWLTRKQIHRAKAEKARERALKDEMDAKRAKTKAARERKLERQAAKRNAMLGEDEE